MSRTGAAPYPSDMASGRRDTKSAKVTRARAPRKQQQPRPSRQTTLDDNGGRSNPRRELVEKQIMEQATRLFAERGFASTTLQDIAEATGLTRPSLYHYVANKDEIFARLVSEIAEAPAVQLRQINKRTDLSPSEKLHEMAISIAMRQAQSPDKFRLLIRSEAELPDELAATYRQSRRQVLTELTRVIEAGIQAGEMRLVDPRTAALGIIGMLNWIAWWHHPGNPQDDRAVATQLADMALRALMQKDVTIGAPEGPARAIAVVRENVDYLERLLNSSADPTDLTPPSD